MWLKLAKNDPKIFFFEKVLFFTVFCIFCKNVLGENSQKKFVSFGLFWAILATFYEFKSRFEKSDKVRQVRKA
jgi:hypothetical protein